MLLGTKSRYAVMAMVEIAARNSDKPVTLAEVAAAQEIPLAYLEQIFMLLKRAGLVRSVRGPGGGYVLSREAAQTWVSDIVLAVDESLKMTRCGHKDGGCMAKRTRCLTHDLWEGLGAQIYAYLRSISLADICQGKPSRPGFQFDVVEAKTQFA